VLHEKIAQPRVLDHLPPRHARRQGESRGQSSPRSRGPLGEGAKMPFPIHPHMLRNAWLRRPFCTAGWLPKATAQPSRRLVGTQSGREITAPRK
jgi:hypothetical protein